MTVGGVDANSAGRSARASTVAPTLEWVRDRERPFSRVMIFDPRPARLDTAWIEIDADSLVALRAVR